MVFLDQEREKVLQKLLNCVIRKYFRISKDSIFKSKENKDCFEDVDIDKSAIISDKVTAFLMLQ